MRATTLLNFLLRLPGTFAVDPGRWQLDSGNGEALVTVRLSRKRLVCPLCTYATGHRYDTRDVDSSWRHLDLAGRVCRVQVRRRRLRCPTHGVRVEGVPFARPGSGFTRDFEDLVTWLVTKTDKTTVCVFARTCVAHRGGDRASASPPTSSTPTGSRGWWRSVSMRFPGASTTNT